MVICKVAKVRCHFSCFVHAIGKMTRNVERVNKFVAKRKVQFVYSHFKLENKESIQIT